MAVLGKRIKGTFSDILDNVTITTMIYSGLAKKRLTQLLAVLTAMDSSKSRLVSC